MYKGLCFNFKTASHSFTDTEFFFFFYPFQVGQLRLSTHLNSSLCDLCSFNSAYQRVSWGKTSFSGNDLNDSVTLLCFSVVTTCKLRGKRQYCSIYEMHSLFSLMGCRD